MELTKNCGRNKGIVWMGFSFSVYNALKTKGSLFHQVLNGCSETPFITSTTFSYFKASKLGLNKGLPTQHSPQHPIEKIQPEAPEHLPSFHIITTLAYQKPTQQAFDNTLTMQEQDWGTYSQASWMTGGAWEDTDRTHRPKKSSKSQPPTTNPTRVPSCDDQLSQDETNCYTGVDLADLRIKLRRWTFARSWKTASSSPRAQEETDLSPLSRPINLDESLIYPNANGPPLPASSQTDTDSRTPLAQRTAIPPLDEDLMAQYLNQCIAAAETQLALARDKSKAKNGAVKEIERLVEKLVRQAELGE